MALLTTEDIIKATGGRLLSDHSEVKTFRGVSIDSRTISEGEIFFALRGPRFDGHDFISDVVSKGVGGIVVDTEKKFQVSGFKFQVIIVQDTLKALQDLAHFLRVRRNISVIAITGSNGKTTTKEMTHAILSRRFKVNKNEKNLNNHIGLPLSLTKINPDDEVFVLELGMNAKGEIRRLCEIAQPTHGVITNIGSAHIGELGGFDAIRGAKLEILPGLSVVALNADDSFLMEGYEAIIRQKGFDGNLITFSINNDSDVKAEDVVITDKGCRFTLKLKDGKNIGVKLNVLGSFNVYNALAASAISLALGITLEEIRDAFEGYTAFPMRFEIIKVGETILINDSYNANPSSVKEALKSLVGIRGDKRTVVILGDMSELGRFSEESHREIGKILSDMRVDVFVAVGEMMGIAAQEAYKYRDDSRPFIYSFQNSDEAMDNISAVLKHGDVVLIKGSRIMNMEKIVKKIRDRDVI